MKPKNKYIQSNPIAAVALTLLLNLIPQAHAADGTWTSESPNFLEPSSYWSNASNWSGGVIANGESANFTTALINTVASSYITLDSSRTIGNMSFNGEWGQSWSLDPIDSGTGLTLATGSGSPIISVAEGVNAAIYAPIAGSQGLVKRGNGSLWLGAANTYTGVTRVSEGFLSVASYSNLGSNTDLVVEATGAVFLNGSTQHVSSVAVIGSGRIDSGNLVSNSYLISNNDESNNYISAGLGGIGAQLTKEGSGTAKLSGVNTYTGATNITEGTLFFSKAHSLYNGESASWSPSNISVNSGATLAVSVGGSFGEFTLSQAKGLLTNLTSNIDNNGLKAGSSFGVDTTNAAGDVTFDQVIADSIGTGGGSLGFTKLGSGKLILNQVNTHTGKNTVDAGTLAISGPGTIGIGNDLTLNDNSTIDLGGTTQTVGDAVFSGGSSVVNGSLVANSYEIIGRSDFGSTTVTASLGGSGASLTITDANTTISGVNTYTGDTNINNNSSLTLSGTGTLGSNSNLNMNNSVLDLGNSVQTVGAVQITGDTVYGTLVSNGTLVGNSFELSTTETFNSISANLVGTGANLVKNGLGKLALTGANSYTGSTTVSGGVLNFDKKTSLYNGDESDWNKNKITVESGGIIEITLGATDSFSLLEAKNIYTELSTNLNNNGLMAGSGFGIHSSWSGPGITWDQLITDSSGVGGGSLSFSVSGFGGVVLNQVNTYSGTTYVDGRLTVSGPGTLGNQADLKIGSLSFGWLNLGNTTQTVGDVILQSGFVENGNLVADSYTSQYGTVNANLGGSNANFTKNGEAGSYVYLNGVNTYGGNTTIESGSLLFENARSLYNADQTKWTKEKITVNSGAVLGVGISGDSFTLTQAKELLSNLTTSINNNGLKAGSSFAINAYEDVTFDQVISDSNGTGGGSLGLQKEGSGSLILNQNNTYTGQTVVRGGSLVVNGNISTSIETTVSNGATISGSGAVGKLVIASDGQVSPGNSPGILNTGDLVMDGVFNAEILGNTVGTEYDQLNVTGTVNLSGSLALALSSFVPLEGDLFFLINNDLNDAVIGTFLGLYQNDTFFDAGQLWAISYTANYGSNSFMGGNDVALKAIPETSSAMLSLLAGLTLLKRRRRR